MVGRDDQEDILHQTSLFEQREEPLQIVIQLPNTRLVEIDQVIYVRLVQLDLAVAHLQQLRGAAVGNAVIRSRKLLLILRQRPVIAVHIVVVEEQEERFPFPLGREPATRLVIDAPGRKIAHMLLDVAELFESPVQSVRTAEPMGVYYPCGPEPILPECVCEGGDLVGKAVVTRSDPASAGVEPGQHGCVGW
jgi:hypothetical protein